MLIFAYNPNLIFMLLNHGKKLLSGICLILVLLGCSAPSGREAVRDIVFRKNYPLTFALDANPSVLTADSTLNAIARNKYEALEADSDIRFTEEEISVVSGRLGALAGSLAPVIRQVREQGPYALYNDLPDNEFIGSAWEQDVRGMNRVLDVYALGMAPRYAAIDSITAPADSPEMVRVRNLAKTNVLATSKDRPFYAVTLESALAFLDANGRLEAADYEPMEEAVNKMAYRAIGRTQWEKYPYSVILVLGCGPERVGEPVSPESRLRAWYGAWLYNQGKAPFIIVSGGRVHPFKTLYSEALEMKQYLMDVCGIPEEAIIAEPHARHTTTNLRNASRIMLSHGIPAGKPGLVTSGQEHIDYVAGNVFPEICLRDMLCVPFNIGERISPREVEFYPLPLSFQLCPLDPLDP